MYTIQYQALHGGSIMQSLDVRSRHKLIEHLARTTLPIIAVYAQTSVITKTVRKELAEWPGSKSRAAREFIDAKTPA